MRSVLDKIVGQKRTGRLDLRGAGVSGSIYFSSGDIYLAELAGHPGVFERLVEAGVESKVIEEAIGGGNVLGALVSSFELSPVAARNILRSHVADACALLMSSEIGHADFTEGDKHPIGDTYSFTPEMVVPGLPSTGFEVVRSRRIEGRGSLATKAEPDPEVVAAEAVSQTDIGVPVAITGRDVVVGEDPAMVVSETEPELIPPDRVPDQEAPADYEPAELAESDVEIEPSLDAEARRAAAKVLLSGL